MKRPIRTKRKKDIAKLEPGGSKKIGETDELIALASAQNDAVFLRLSTGEQGLSKEEAQRRLLHFGPNDAGKSAKRNGLLNFLRHFANPLIVQLLVIAGVSFLMRDYRSASVVGGMLLLSVLLSFIQEERSGRAAERLREMVSTTAVTIRDGDEKEVRLSEVVPGDVVALEAGSIVPADLRLFSVKDFFVTQASLTGESLPVEKTAVPCVTAGRTATDFPNTCFQGTSVVSGTARGVVVHTGADTVFGALARKLAGHRSRTSFEKGISGFTWLMIRFMVVLVLLVFLVVGLTKGSWINALLFSLAVAVGLTPEMLPMIVTVNLARGAMVMSRKKVIVKKLNSIQNLGAIDILCTDKTGTLTQDRVVLEKHVDVADRESQDVLRYAYMNSHFQTGLRNLLDRAILAHGEFEVERTCRKVDEIPFDFTRKRMSVVVNYLDDHVLICKGAVENVFAACSRYQVDEEIYPLIDTIRQDVLEDYGSLSAQGYRVLAIAYREFPNDKLVFGSADESDLILLGYIAFFDPPKDSAVVSLRALKEAGVSVKILTGDNELVTRKIALEVGLDAGTVVTGPEIEGLSLVQLAETAERTTVFARLSPSQKERIIEALQGKNHVVGYLGDGINDAPALRKSDVGISVDTAADVAKDAADIILLEKSLTVLADGIREGRKVFGNIVKYVRMGASSNFGNMFSVLGGSVFLPFLPMAPVQVLVNNLLYDVSQIGIPSDRVDPEFLASPRRWNIANIRRFMLFIGPVSSLFDFATFLLMLFFFGCVRFSDPGTSAALRTHYESLFQTGWFVESILTQTLIVHVIRTRKIPFLQSRASPTMLFFSLTVAAIAVALPYSPLGPFIGLVPLPAVYWLWIASFLVLYVGLAHLVKTLFFKHYGVD